jgi:hypothetical protein
MNSLSGTHGSKQGWGGDQFWTAASSVINSVGYTDRYFVAILQNSHSYPDPARSTATYAARTIAASRKAVAAAVAPVVRNGDFVRRAGDAHIYRVAGGAPIIVHSWSAFGGPKPVKVISAARFAALRPRPADGTFLAATGSSEVYKIVYGAITYVDSWSHVGGHHPYTVVDATAIRYAGRGGVWSHLRAKVPDGSFIGASGTHQSFVVAGGAPVYISTWDAVGGPRKTQQVDRDAISRAGQPGHWSHLSRRPKDGTYLSVGGSAAIYRVAGGAPLHVAALGPLDGSKVAVKVDERAIRYGGRAGAWAHLNFYPATGTFLTGAPGRRVYRVVAGRATYVPSWKPYGGARPTVLINQVTIDRAGTGGELNHLRR